MKKAEAKKNTKSNKADLIKEMQEKQVLLRDHRFGLAGSKSKNVKEQKNIKKEIARIQTIIGNLKTEN